jgi:probable rRNA maturation factor
MRKRSELSQDTNFQVEIQIAAGLTEQVDESSLQGAVVAALRHAGAPASAALTLVLTDDEEVRRLNKQFRHLDAPTDVLAFPAAAPAPFVDAPGQSPYLGDVIISHQRAMAQAADARHSVQDELALLTVHGTLHLLGHDHSTSQEKASMWAAQEAILAQLGLQIEP